MNLMRGIHKASAFPNSDWLVIAECREDHAAQHVTQADHWMMMSAAIGTRWILNQVQSRLPSGKTLHRGRTTEEAQRLQQKRRSAEQRVDDVKEMLTYFMRCRGLKRLEGELNTIRLQTNSQASLQIDDWELPQEFCLHTGNIPHRLLKEMLEYLPDGLKGEFLEAKINTQPDTQLVRDALLRGETVAGAQLERRSHIRID